MADKIFNNSTQSSDNELYSESEIYTVLNNNFNQYFVSAHSLKAMYILDKNSFPLIAYSASVIFAPMLVPERVI